MCSIEHSWTTKSGGVRDYFHIGVIGYGAQTGEVWDNSAMESFFISLKTERTARRVYRTRAEARADVFEYVERFYSPTRRHSTLGYVSPIEFEKASRCLSRGPRDRQQPIVVCTRLRGRRAV